MPRHLSLTDEQVRRWLLNYYRPDLLTDAVIRDVLRLHGRPHYEGPLAVAAEFRKLLDEKIEALRPARDAPIEAWGAYLALHAYKQNKKLFRLANDIYASTRTASRARARGLALLRAELENPPG